MTNQDSPIQHGHNDAELQQKLDGLVTQVRADYLQGTSMDAAAMLQQRLVDAHIEIGRGDEFEALLKKVTG